LYSATCALTCPVCKSTSQTETVVVPISTAAPHSGASSLVWPGSKSSNCAGQSGQSQVPELRIAVTCQSPSRKTVPSLRRMLKEMRNSVAPLFLRMAVCRRLQSSFWSSMLGGDRVRFIRRMVCAVRESYPSGTVTSATVRSVVRRRSIFSCGGTVISTSPSTTVWQANA